MSAAWDSDDRYVLRHDHHHHHHRGHDNSNIIEDTVAARQNVIKRKWYGEEDIVGRGHLLMKRIKRKVLSKYKTSCCKGVQISILRTKARRK